MLSDFKSNELVNSCTNEWTEAGRIDAVSGEPKKARASGTTKASRVKRREEGPPAVAAGAARFPGWDMLRRERVGLKAKQRAPRSSSRLSVSVRTERSPPPSFPPRSDKPSGSDEISGAFLQARTVGRRVRSLKQLLFGGLHALLRTAQRSSLTGQASAILIINSASSTLSLRLLIKR